MLVSFSEFKNGVKNSEERPIYLFEGEDSFFRNRGVQLIKDTFVSEPDLNYKVFEGESADINEIASSLESFPFLSKKRLTVVKEFYPDKADLKGRIKDFLENPPNDSVLVIANSKSFEGLKKFSNVYAVDCKKADQATIAKWVEAECAKYNVKVERSAALMLAEYCLCDMARIEVETDKLISYAIKDGEITQSTIELLINKDSEYKIYEMTDFIGKKKFAMALAVIKEMMAKGEPPQRLIISIYNYYRRLLHVAISDKDNGTLANLLEVKEFAVKKAKEQAKMFSKRSIKHAVDILIEADYNSKNGNMDFGEAFWLSIFKIMVES